MPLSVVTNASMVISGGPTFGAAKPITTSSGLAEVVNLAIIDPAVSTVVEIGGGNTSQITSLFLSVSSACTISVNNSPTTVSLSAGEFWSLSGASAAMFINYLSGGSTFDQIKITTNGQNVLLNVAVLFNPES